MSRSRIRPDQQHRQFPDECHHHARQTQISNLSDLDYAQAASQYSQESIALQAAEQSYADISQLSLFKFL